MVSHAHPGTTSSALTRLSIRAARTLGVPERQYGHLPGVTTAHLDDDLCRMPSGTTNRIAELTTGHVAWTGLAAVLARQSPLGTFGVWDYLVTSAPTPLDGLRDAAEHLAAVADAGTDALHVSEDGDLITVSHANRGDLTHEAACAVRGYALALYQDRISEAAGRRIVPVCVSLAVRTPRHHADLTALYGTGTLEFEAPVTALTFRASDLRAPSPQGRPGLSAVLRRHAAQQLAASVPLRDWLDLFRASLAAVPDGAAPTLAEVARRMNHSTRTVQRRLEEHGTTWRGETERLRRERATRLLLDTGLGVEAIAARTGYADARALRRAVRRWHGTTPAALRRDGARP
ncbi:helix-turn-helix domain-containing protein [Streptomyces sp. NPDC097619]|uniref:AraC family transcriptional regulator n=1 Tax=Streptomyces sp. NPDC097619 TaxID=3157228 RepID=UPI0033334B3A